MNDFSQYAEYSVEKKRSAVFCVLKYICPFICVIISVLLCLLTVSFYGPEISLIIGAAVLIASLLYCFSFFKTIHFDYRITNGDIYFSKVINKRKRKELSYHEISKFEIIAPYSEQYTDIAARCEAVYDYSSGIDNDNTYFAVISNEDTKSKSLFIFEPSEKMLKQMRFYNRNTVL